MCYKPNGKVAVTDDDDGDDDDDNEDVNKTKNNLCIFSFTKSL